MTAPASHIPPRPPEAARQEPAANPQTRNLDNSREAITYFRPLEEREADRAPLSAHLIRRIFTYTRPYAARRRERGDDAT